MNHSPSWGVMAEFAGADALLAAAHAVRAAGHARIEAYAPFHVEGLAEAIGAPPPRVPRWTFVGTLVGGVGAYWLQWHSAVISEAIDVGGRPFHSWPMFVPVAFEMAILGGALAALLALLAGARLPTLHHPVFDAPDFDLASRNRFFLGLRADAAGFDAAAAARLLDEQRPLRRFEVTT